MKFRNLPKLKATTLAELLVTMALSGLLILAVYDGISLINAGRKSLEKTDFDAMLLRHERIETLMHGADSVSVDDTIIIFHAAGTIIDTIHLSFKDSIYGFQNFVLFPTTDFVTVRTEFHSGIPIDY